MRESYIHPGVFSWNERNGILAKVDGAKLDIEKGDADCIFLEKKSDDSYLCKIYEHRPSVCSGYLSSNNKCKEKSFEKRWSEHIANIFHIDIIEGSIFLTTRQTMATGCQLPEFFVRSDARLEKLCTSLKKEIETVILASLPSPSSEARHSSIK